VSVPVLDRRAAGPPARGGRAGDGIGIRATGKPAPVPGTRGREAETAILDGAIGRAASGRLAVVLIDGEAGIGKTRLVQDALETARGRGLQVAAGRAAELDRTRPFGLVAGMFGCARSSPDPRRAAIGELLGAAESGEGGPITVTSDPGLQFRAVDAFADLAEELALAGPLVIGADDLHWADPSSLLTLGALAARLACLPVAIIGCFRPSPRSAGLERLAGALEAAGGRRMTLRELDGRAVAELVADAVGAAPGRRLLAGMSGAAGNPLFVTELVGALTQERMITIADGRAEVTGPALAPALRLTILRRISFLPERTLQALRFASILGSGFTLTDLAAGTGRPALELAETLSEAIRARVLQDDGTRLRFRHDLIRDAICEDLPGSVRGAARDLARAEAALRETGIRRGRRGSRGRPQFGWDSLTPTERSVAGLVAEGLSNPQIGERLYISRRTVQTHLAHIFAKLDITARAQLAAEVTRRQRLTDLRGADDSAARGKSYRNGGLT